jgi:long-subunit fatty acid transport protein
MREAFTVLAVLCAAGAAAAQDQQLGARTKAMGGSYTAFEDDPVLVWLNPAGIATQPDQASIVYQTYTAYPTHEDPGALPADPEVFSVDAETVLPDPEFIPSYLGFVFRLGTPESPMALGICYARPYLLHYAMHELTAPGETVFEPKFGVEQSLSRVRVAFAKDFRFRPAGEAGFFNHLAFGAGLDLGLERWRFTDPDGDRTGTSLALGCGGGVLLGVYHDPDVLTFQVGAAYQSPVRFDFAIDPVRFPAFDMPEQVNAGASLYLHGAVPLRLTVDVQTLAWKDTAQDPSFAGYRGFRDATNVSFGAEYRLDVGSNVTLFPRAGLRRFEAPWEDPDDLPSTGRFKLVLDTDDDTFSLITFGLGISWTSATGKVRSIDLAGDTGGDAFNVALGYTHEF